MCIGFHDYRFFVCFLIIKPVKITDDDAVESVAVAIFWRNAVVPSAGVLLPDW